FTKFPQAPIKSYTSTWADVVKTIYESSSFGDELNRTGYFENDINALVATVSDPMARASLIFNFVNSKVKWNGYVDIANKEGVRKAYKAQNGNVADLHRM